MKLRNVHIPLCRWSGLVGSFLNSTTQTRPDQTRPTDRLGIRQVRRLCQVVDLSAQSRHVRSLSVGLVWSGRRQSPCVRLVVFGNDTTRPDQRQILVGSGIPLVEFGHFLFYLNICGKGWKPLICR